MQRISLSPYKFACNGSFLIQVLGFKDTYIWLRDDKPSQKKRGNLRLTKALNANSKVTLRYLYDFKRDSKCTRIRDDWFLRRQIKPYAEQQRTRE